MGFLIRISICLLVGSLCICSYLDCQNEATRYRMEIPKVQEEIDLLVLESKKLSFLIDKFEAPSNLLELAKLPEYSSLHYPLSDEVFSLDEGRGLENLVEQGVLPSLPARSIFPVATRIGHSF